MSCSRDAASSSVNTGRRSLVTGVLLAGLTLTSWQWAHATHQPPHDSSFGVECLSCHIPHGSVGNILTRADTVPTLCMTCHNPGDQASNLPFSEWQQIFQGERMTAALLDRLTHHCEIFEMNGESYRFRESMKQKQSSKAVPKSSRPTRKKAS